MTADLLDCYQTCPAYKDSGVEWLGEIPSHWEVFPLRSFARSGYKTFTDGDWIESPYIRKEGIRLIQTGNIGIGFFKEQGYRYIDETTFDAFRCTEIFPGDVLICRLADPVGRACLAPDLGKRMITSVDVCILKTGDSVDVAFLVYLLSSDRYLSWLTTLSRGSTRQRISRSMLGSLRLQLPPFPEQQAIGRFLDHKTSEIDNLIAAKKRLITLLQEKRAALITQAVTKGLDPSVPMKDSGIEWLGEIPAHWEVTKLRRVCYLQQGLQIAQALRHSESGPNRYEYITIRSIHAGDSLENRDYVENPPARVICKPEDILLARTGATGEVVTDLSGVFHNNFFKVNYDDSTVRKDFLVCYLSNRLVREHLLLLAGTTTIPDLNHGDFLDTPFLRPDIHEQSNLVKYIRDETQRMDTLLAKVQEGIERLQQYRTALISAAVTGKIDVRDYA